ncbi:hypothetical protein ABTM42_20135, partial [Acinetobacter baumannii]
LGRSDVDRIDREGNVADFGGAWDYRSGVPVRSRSRFLDFEDQTPAVCRDALWSPHLQGNGAICFRRRDKRTW